MRLGDWLTTNKVTDREFAERMGWPISTVNAYRHGTRHPSRARMRAIKKETWGQVTAEDFIEEK